MKTKTKTLYMETTEIAPEKSAAEITTLLVRSGARSLEMQYGEEGKLNALSFSLVVGSNLLTFVLPVRVVLIEDAHLRCLITFNIIDHLRRKRPSPTTSHAVLFRYTTPKDEARLRSQAERVAWRQLLRWVQAQLALIETGIVAAHEVFLPYLLHAGTQQTLFEYFSGEVMNLLTAAAGKPQ